MSPIIDDLRVEAEIPPQAHRPGALVVVTLKFSNLSARPRMLFLINDGAYRSGQSTFLLQIGSGPPLVQPLPQPGYVPTTADFHEIGPRETLAFKQGLRLPREIPPGDYVAQWVYENEVKCWPDAPSLPGTPPEASAGEPIAGIWLGRIEDRFDVKVGAGRIGPDRRR